MFRGFYNWLKYFWCRFYCFGLFFYRRVCRKKILFVQRSKNFLFFCFSRHTLYYIMYSMILYFIAAGFFLWILILTVIVFKLRNHYYNLTSSTKKEKLDDILESLIANDVKKGEELMALKQRVEEEIKNSELHLQKVSLVRFNPFERTGGSESFVVCLLDNHQNGIIFNFIYTKDGLRVYTKRVREGRGVEYELSKEEEKAIEKAVNS